MHEYLPAHMPAHHMVLPLPPGHQRTSPRCLCAPYGQGCRSTCRKWPHGRIQRNEAHTAANRVWEGGQTGSDTSVLCVGKYFVLHPCHRPCAACSGRVSGHRSKPAPWEARSLTCHTRPSVRGRSLGGTCHTHPSRTSETLLHPPQRGSWASGRSHHQTRTAQQPGTHARPPDTAAGKARRTTHEETLDRRWHNARLCVSGTPVTLAPPSLSKAAAVQPAAVAREVSHSVTIYLFSVHGCRCWCDAWAFVLAARRAATHARTWNRRTSARSVGTSGWAE